MNSICRLCFRSDLYNLKVQTQEGPEFTLYSVDHRNEDGVTITTLIRTLLPELYLGISANPRICNQCYESLKAAFSFRFKCLLTDKLIGIYTRESILPKTSVNLWDVVNYWLNVYCKMPTDANAARIADWFGFKEKNFKFPSKTMANICLADVKIFLKNFSKLHPSEGENCQAFVTTNDHNQVVSKQEIPGKNLSDGAKENIGISGLNAKGCPNEANIDFVHTEDDDEEWAEHIKILIDSDAEEGAALEERAIHKNAPIKIRGRPVPNMNKLSKVIQTSEPPELHFLDLKSPASTAIKVKSPSEIASMKSSSGSTLVGRNSVTQLDKSFTAPHAKTLSKTKTQGTPSESCVPPLTPCSYEMSSIVKSLAEHSAGKEENFQRLLKAKSESDHLDKTRILKPKQVKSESMIIGKICSGNENLKRNSVTECMIHGKKMNSEHLLRTENTALSPGIMCGVGNMKILNIKSITENKSMERDQPAGKSSNCITNKPTLIKQKSANENGSSETQTLRPGPVSKIKNLKNLSAEFTTERHISGQENTHDDGIIKSSFKTKVLSKLNDAIKANQKLLLKSEVKPPRICKRKIFKIRTSCDSIMKETSPGQEFNLGQRIDKADNCIQTKIIKLKSIINSKENLLSKSQITTLELNKIEKSKISNTERVTHSTTLGQNPDQWPTKCGISAKRKILSPTGKEHSPLESQVVPHGPMYLIGNPENLDYGSFTMNETPDTKNDTQQDNSACNRIKASVLKPNIEDATKSIENQPSKNECLTPELLCAFENLENLNREITAQACQYSANQTSNFDLIDIKDEPLDFNFDTNYDWNNFSKAGTIESLGGVIKQEDNEDTRSASETEVENFLISQNIPDVDLEPDIPDYVLVTRRHPVPTMPVLENPQPSNNAVCRPESNNIVRSTKNYSLSKPKSKAISTTRKLARVDMEKGRNNDETWGMCTQSALYDIPHSDQSSNVCVLYKNFTDDGDYINDHDYLVNPYRKNDLTTNHKLFGNMCICLLCGLKHASEEHIKHMQQHSSICLICKVNFKNVFILNLHVRSHVWHCEECGEIVTYSRHEGHHKFHMLKHLTEQQRIVKLKGLTQKERAMKLKRLTEQERGLQTKLIHSAPSPIKYSPSRDSARRTRRKNFKGNGFEQRSTSRNFTHHSGPITLESLLSKSPKSKQESRSNITARPHKTMSENLAGPSCKHITLKTLLDNSIIAELKRSSSDTKNLNQNRENEALKNRSRKRRHTGLSPTCESKKEFKSTEIANDDQCSSWEVKVEAYPKVKRSLRTEIKKKKEDAKPVKNLPTRSCKGKLGHKEVSEKTNEVLHVKTNLKAQENSCKGAEVDNGESSSLPRKRQKRESKLKTLDKMKNADGPERSKAGLKSKAKKAIKNTTISPRALRAKARSEAQLTEELESSITGKTGK